MRVLLPLACVALLVLASGAFADLTPLPESEWGTIVGGQVPEPEPDPQPIDIPEEWDDQIDPEDWEAVENSVCAGDPAAEDVPDLCSGDPGCRNLYVEIGGVQTFVCAVWREVGAYKVCSPQVGVPAVSCSQGQIPCAHLLYSYTGENCTGQRQNTPDPWVMVTGCQLSAVALCEDPIPPGE